MRPELTYGAYRNLSRWRVESNRFKLKRAKLLTFCLPLIAEAPLVRRA
jgi:hypothetical protein